MNKKGGWKKRLISFVLAAAMVLPMGVTTALASGTHYVTLGSGPYWWRFVSRTADKKHANTDDTFYFTIYGRDGREDKFELDGDWDDRERGNLEYYTLKSNIPFWAATGWRLTQKKTGLSNDGWEYSEMRVEVGFDEAGSSWYNYGNVLLAGGSIDGGSKRLDMESWLGITETGIGSALSGTQYVSENNHSFLARNGAKLYYKPQFRDGTFNHQLFNPLNQGNPGNYGYLDPKLTITATPNLSGVTLSSWRDGDRLVVQNTGSKDLYQAMKDQNVDKLTLKFTVDLKGPDVGINRGIGYIQNNESTITVYRTTFDMSEGGVHLTGMDKTSSNGAQVKSSVPDEAWAMNAISAGSRQMLGSRYYNAANNQVAIWAEPTKIYGSSSMDSGLRSNLRWNMKDTAGNAATPSMTLGKGGSQSLNFLGTVNDTATWAFGIPDGIESSNGLYFTLPVSYSEFNGHRYKLYIDDNGTRRAADSANAYLSTYKADTKKPTLTLATDKEGTLFNSNNSRTLTLYPMASEKVYTNKNDWFNERAEGYLVYEVLRNGAPVAINSYNSSGTYRSGQYAPVTTTYQMPMTVSLKDPLEGAFTLRFSGQDVAGNLLTGSEYSIHLDNLSPRVTPVYQQTKEGDGSRRQDVDFQLTDCAEDYRVYYCFVPDGGTVPAQPALGSGTAAPGSAQGKDGVWYFLDKKNAQNGSDVASLKAEKGTDWTGTLYYYTADYYKDGGWGNQSNMASKAITIYNKDAGGEVTLNTLYSHALSSYDISVTTDPDTSLEYYWAGPEMHQSGVPTWTQVPKNKLGDLKLGAATQTNPVSKQPVTMPGPYTHYHRFCHDVSGNRSEVRTLALDFDNGTPTISDLNWVSPKVGKTFQAKVSISDPSGLRSATYQLRDRSGQELDGYAPVSIPIGADGKVDTTLFFSAPENGVFTLCLTAEGSNSNDVSTKSYNFTDNPDQVFISRVEAPTLDISPDSGIHEVDQVLYTAGDYTVTLTVQENMLGGYQGQERFCYQLSSDGANWTPWTGGGAMALSGDEFTGEITLNNPFPLAEGRNALYFRTACYTGTDSTPVPAEVDSALVSQAQELLLYLDSAAPEVHITYANLATDGADDPNNGRGPDIPGTRAADGAHSDGQASDSSLTSSTLRTRGSVVATLTVADGGSGVSRVEAADGLAFTDNRDGTYSVTVENNVTTTVTVTDRAGNRTTLPLEVAWIQRDPPQAELTLFTVADLTGGITQMNAAVRVSGERSSDFVLMPENEALTEKSFTEKGITPTAMERTADKEDHDGNCNAVYQITANGLNGRYYLAVRSQDDLGNTTLKQLGEVFTLQYAAPEIVSVSYQPGMAGVPMAQVTFDTEVAVFQGVASADSEKPDSQDEEAIPNSVVSWKPEEFSNTALVSVSLAENTTLYVKDRTGETYKLTVAPPGGDWQSGPSVGAWLSKNGTSIRFTGAHWEAAPVPGTVILPGRAPEEAPLPEGNADLIAAPLHDARGDQEGLADEELCAAGSYRVVGVQNGDNVDVAIAARDLAQHQLEGDGQLGYWVGLGVILPQESENTDSESTVSTKVSVAAGFGEYPDNADFSIYVPVDSVEQEGKTYSTFYFDAAQGDTAYLAVKETVTTVPSEPDPDPEPDPNPNPEPDPEPSEGMDGSSGGGDGAVLPSESPSEPGNAPAARGADPEVTETVTVYRVDLSRVTRAKGMDNLRIALDDAGLSVTYDQLTASPVTFTLYRGGKQLADAVSSSIGRGLCQSWTAENLSLTDFSGVFTVKLEQEGSAPVELSIGEADPSFEPVHWLALTDSEKLLLRVGPGNGANGPYAAQYFWVEDSELVTNESVKANASPEGAGIPEGAQLYTSLVLDAAKAVKKGEKAVAIGVYTETADGGFSVGQRICSLERIDFTPPVAQRTIAADKDTVTVTVDFSDPESGIAKVERLENGEWTTEDLPATQPGDGGTAHDSASAASKLGDSFSYTFSKAGDHSTTHKIRPVNGAGEYMEYVVKYPNNADIPELPADTTQPITEEDYKISYAYLGLGDQWFPLEPEEKTDGAPVLPVKGRAVRATLSLTEAGRSKGLKIMNGGGKDTVSLAADTPYSFHLRSADGASAIAAALVPTAFDRTGPVLRGFTVDDATITESDGTKKQAVSVTLRQDTVQEMAGAVLVDAAGNKIDFVGGTAVVTQVGAYLIRVWDEAGNYSELPVMVVSIDTLEPVVTGVMYSVPAGEVTSGAIEATIIGFNKTGVRIVDFEPLQGGNLSAVTYIAGNNLFRFKDNVGIEITLEDERGNKGHQIIQVGSTNHTDAYGGLILPQFPELTATVRGNGPDGTMGSAAYITLNYRDYDPRTDISYGEFRSLDKLKVSAALLGYGQNAVVSVDEMNKLNDGKGVEVTEHGAYLFTVTDEAGSSQVVKAVVNQDHIDKAPPKVTGVSWTYGYMQWDEGTGTWTLKTAEGKNPEPGNYTLVSTVDANGAPTGNLATNQTVSVEVTTDKGVRPIGSADPWNTSNSKEFPFNGSYQFNLEAGNNTSLQYPVTVQLIDKAAPTFHFTDHGGSGQEVYFVEGSGDFDPSILYNVPGKPAAFAVTDVNEQGKEVDLTDRVKIDFGGLIVDPDRFDENTFDRNRPYYIRYEVTDGVGNTYTYLRSVRLIAFTDTIALVNGVMPDSAGNASVAGSSLRISLKNRHGSAWVKVARGSLTMGEMKSLGKYIPEDKATGVFAMDNMSEGYYTVQVQTDYRDYFIIHIYVQGN